MTTNPRSFQPGQALAGRPKNVTLERMRGFSGWPTKNIHTDEGAAKACGLPAPIASATMYIGYLADFMLDTFGDDWIRRGRLDLAFVKMVLPGDVLIPKGVVQTVTGEGPSARLTLEVFCENQRGEKVAAGTAAVG